MLYIWYVFIYNLLQFYTNHITSNFLLVNDDTVNELTKQSLRNTHSIILSIYLKHTI
jgi:hypothetical protein